MSYYLGYTFINNNGDPVIRFIYNINFDKLRNKSKHSLNQHHNYFYTQCRMKMMDMNSTKLGNITRYKINYFSYSEYLFSKFTKDKIFSISPLSDYEYYPDLVICNTYVVSKYESWISISNRIFGDISNAEYLAKFNNSSLDSKLIAGEVVKIPNISSFKPINSDKKNITESIKSNFDISKYRIRRCRDNDIPNIIHILSPGDIILSESDFSYIKKLYCFNGSELVLIGEG